MKFGVRKPSLTRSFKARTTGRWKRAMKRAIIPGYGRRGMGLLHPKRAMYNRIYRRTTVSAWDLAKVFSKTGTSRRRASVPVAPTIDWTAVEADINRRIMMLPQEKQALLYQQYQAHALVKRTVYVYWLFTGFVGGHRFYMHDYLQGIFMVLALLYFHWYALIWWLFDGLLVNRRILQGNIMMKKALLETMEDDVLAAVLPTPAATTTMADADTPATLDSLTATQAVAMNLPSNAIAQFYPPDTEKFAMNDAEKIFFRNFFVHFSSLGYPAKISVNRLSDGTLNFCYAEKQIGRVRLQKRKHTMQVLTPDKVDVIEGELPQFLENLPRWMDYLMQIGA